jgi:hypothetical protein
MDSFYEFVLLEKDHSFLSVLSANYPFYFYLFSVSVLDLIQNYLIMSATCITLYFWRLLSIFMWRYCFKRRLLIVLLSDRLITDIEPCFLLDFHGKYCNFKLFISLLKA